MADKIYQDIALKRTNSPTKTIVPNDIGGAGRIVVQYHKGIEALYTVNDKNEVVKITKTKISELQDDIGIQSVSGDIAASRVKFSDGTTFQQKLDDDSLRGHQGPKGDTGSQGPRGPQGATGPQGPKGTDGTNGTNGSQGPRGPQGSTGPSFTVTSSTATKYLVGKSTNATQASTSSTWYVSSAYEKAGILYATDFIASSDKRLKTNIKEIANIPENLLNSKLFKEFDWIESGKHGYGVIAQELEAIMPDLVDVNEETGLKSVKYLQLHSIQLWYAMKKIAELEKKISELSK